MRTETMVVFSTRIERARLPTDVTDERPAARPPRDAAEARGTRTHAAIHEGPQGDGERLSDRERTP
jgi:hypothetical protein